MRNMAASSNLADRGDSQRCRKLGRCTVRMRVRGEAPSTEVSTNGARVRAGVGVACQVCAQGGASVGRGALEDRGLFYFPEVDG